MRRVFVLALTVLLAAPGLSVASLPDATPRATAVADQDPCTAVITGTISRSVKPAWDTSSDRDADTIALELVDEQGRVAGAYYYLTGPAAALRNGSVNAGDVPAIRLVDRGGVLFTLDNRRLAAFQQAGVPVPYRMATAEEIANESWKFTTQNDGTSIRIRGEH